MAGFDEYLRKALCNGKDARYLLDLSNRYQHVLTTDNASDLLTLSHNVRRNTMRALAHLAKFNGCYEKWQSIIKQHGIHWRQTDSGFTLFEKESITEMLDYIKKAIKVLPPACGNTFVAATLLGLRADEACKAITLLKQETKDYHNKELGILEHYRFKEHFIRRTKKAYISIVDEEILALAKQSCDSREAINSRLKRLKLPMNMKYCRKVFGTWLRQHGIESEFIDVLQGRVAATVFAKHYYRPDPATLIKVRLLIKELRATVLETSLNRGLKVNEQHQEAHQATNQETAL